MSVNPELAQGVIKVGDGRGFIIEAKENRLVVTAAHCLPSFPPPAASVGYDERTYQNLLGVIDGEPSVWCELLFADPVADIAVLGAPDGQALYDQHDAYLALTNDRPTLRVADPPGEFTDAWLLSLDGDGQQRNSRRYVRLADHRRTRGNRRGLCQWRRFGDHTHRRRT